MELDDDLVRNRSSARNAVRGSASATDESAGGSLTGDPPASIFFPSRAWESSSDYFFGKLLKF